MYAMCARLSLCIDDWFRHSMYGRSIQHRRDRRLVRVSDLSGRFGVSVHDREHRPGVSGRLLLPRRCDRLYDLSGRVRVSGHECRADPVRERLLDRGSDRVYAVSGRVQLHVGECDHELCRRSVFDRWLECLYAVSGRLRVSRHDSTAVPVSRRNLLDRERHRVLAVSGRDRVPTHGRFIDRTVDELRTGTISI